MATKVNDLINLDLLNEEIIKSRYEEDILMQTHMILRHLHYIIRKIPLSRLNFYTDIFYIVFDVIPKIYARNVKLNEMEDLCRGIYFNIRKIYEKILEVYSKCITSNQKFTQDLYHTTILEYIEENNKKEEENIVDITKPNILYTEFPSLNELTASPPSSSKSTYNLNHRQQKYDKSNCEKFLLKSIEILYNEFVERYHDIITLSYFKEYSSFNVQFKQEILNKYPIIYINLFKDLKNRWSAIKKKINLSNNSKEYKKLFIMLKEKMEIIQIQYLIIEKHYGNWNRNLNDFSGNHQEVDIFGDFDSLTLNLEDSDLSLNISNKTDILPKFEFKNLSTTSKTQKNKMIEGTTTTAKEINSITDFNIASVIINTAVETIMNRPIKYIIRTNCVPEGYIDLRTVWCKSRWTSLRFELIENNYIESTFFLLPLPVYRKKFQISDNGTFGPIEIGLSKDYFSTYAIRRLTEHQLSIEYCDELQRTINEMKDLQHNNVLQSFISQDCCGHFFFYTKLCEYNLAQFMHVCIQKNEFNSDMLKRVINGIVKGLAALHNYRRPIIHGNLKPTNILIDEFQVIKLAEFGIYEYIFKEHAEIPVKKRIWWANECLNSYKITKTCEFTKMSDIQSLGMILHYFGTEGGHPYGDMFEEIIENITRNQYHLYVQSTDLWLLLESMLYPLPSRRPDINKIINHIYFWTDERKWEFLNVCLAIANSEYQPLYANPLLTKRFCATLERNWYRTATKIFWVPVACFYFPGLNIPYGTQLDSGIGLVKFLITCRFEQPWVFFQPGYVLQIYPQLPGFLYEALVGTEWFKRSDLKKFDPSN